jgi:hypothetical protein
VDARGAELLELWGSAADEYPGGALSRAGVSGRDLALIASG